MKKETGLNTRALITGLTGQDGYYLAAHLLARGCDVTGAVRPDEMTQARALADELGPIRLVPFALDDPHSAAAAIERVHPDVIYHLAAQSSVARSWKEPVATAQVNAIGTLHLLEAIRCICPACRFVMAGSCDCFDHDAAGDSGITPATPFKATNPYAASKIMAHQLTQCYRNHYGLRASVAIMFNHTSPRRSEIFVERGIVRQAVRVCLGQAEAITIGSYDTRRDWSWAPDIMEGFAMLGDREEPADVVLASGRTLTVDDWVRETCAQLGLDPMRHVRVDSGRLHPGDRPHSFGNIELARSLLGWSPRVGLAAMVAQLIQYDMEQLKERHEVH